MNAELNHVISYTELFNKKISIPKNIVLFDTMGSRQGAVCAEYIVQKMLRCILLHNFLIHILIWFQVGIGQKLIRC